MQVAHVGPQHLERLAVLHAALHEVGGVVRRQDLPGEGLEDLQAALGHVAVDVLLVLVQELDAAAARGLHQAAQALQDLVAEGLRRLALRQEEGEDADVLGLHGVRHVQKVPERIQVRQEGVADADLADGRAQGGDAKAPRLHAGKDGLGLGGRIVRDVLAVDAAGFDVVDVQLLHDVHLDVQGGVDLVAKAGEDEFRHA